MLLHDDMSDVNDWKPTSELFAQLAETDSSFQLTKNERIYIEDTLGRIVPPELIIYMVTARRDNNYSGACTLLQAHVVGSDDFESETLTPIKRVAKLIVGTDSCW